MGSPPGVGQREPLPLRVALPWFGLTRVAEHSVLSDADPDARNTLAEPDRVTPHPGTGATLGAGELTVTLEPLSWTMLRLS